MYVRRPNCESGWPVDVVAWSACDQQGPELRGTVNRYHDLPVWQLPDVAIQGPKKMNCSSIPSGYSLEIVDEVVLHPL